MNNRTDSLLFATCYVANEQAWMARYQPWLRYYQSSALAGIPMLLIDDGSPYEPCSKEVHIAHSLDQLDFENAKVNIFRFPNNLGRSSLQSYPGWWRSFLFSATVVQHTRRRKLIHIESDAFIISDRFFKQILDLEVGWVAPWLSKYQLPETAIQVICSDQISSLERLKQHADLNKKMAEEILPFTEINKDWVGDRYSEFKRNRWIFRSKKFDRIKLFQNDFFYAPIPANADFATQVVPRQLHADRRFQNAL
jgi:hypothetical protein